MSILIEKYGAAPEITQAGAAGDEEDEDGGGNEGRLGEKWKAEKKEKKLSKAIEEKHRLNVENFDGAEDEGEDYEGFNEVGEKIIPFNLKVRE